MLTTIIIYLLLAALATILAIGFFRGSRDDA